MLVLVLPDSTLEIVVVARRRVVSAVYINNRSSSSPLIRLFDLTGHIEASCHVIWGSRNSGCFPLGFIEIEYTYGEKSISCIRGLVGGDRGVIGGGDPRHDVWPQNVDLLF